VEWAPPRGAAKNNRRTPTYIFYIADPPTRHPTFFFLDLFFVRFSAFLGKGSSKTPLKYFCKKSTETRNFDASFSLLDFFCFNNNTFIAFSGVSQRWEFKSTTKNVLQKNRVEKFLQKNRSKIQNRFVSRFYFYHVLGRFLVRGVQKHDKKY
jgi:hypothetical protein